MATRLQLGVNAISCPICKQLMHYKEFEAHLKTEHGIKIPKARQIHVALPNRPILSGAEWGKPYFVLFRIPVPQDKWKTEEVHINEQCCYLTDENGNPTPFTNPTEVIANTVMELRRNGIDPRYIKIENEKMYYQCHASPLPGWAIFLIVLAVVTAIIGVNYYLFLMFLNKLVALSVEALQDIWPYLIPIIVMMALAFGYQVYASKRKG